MMKCWFYSIAPIGVLICIVAAVVVNLESPATPPVIKDGKVFCGDGYRLKRNWREHLVCRKDETPNGKMLPHEMESNPAHEV